MYRELNQVMLSFLYLIYYRLHLFSMKIKGEKNRLTIVSPKICLRDLMELVRIIIDSPPLLPQFVRAFFACFLRLFRLDLSYCFFYFISVSLLCGSRSSLLLLSHSVSALPSFFLSSFLFSSLPSSLPFLFSSLLPPLLAVLYR